MRFPRATRRIGDLYGVAGPIRCDSGRAGTWVGQGLICLAGTSFPCLGSLGRALDGEVDRDWSVGSGGAWLPSGRVADDVVPQGFPFDLPGPVGGQVQHRFAGRRGEAGRTR